MESLNSIRERLESHYSNSHRRIWVQPNGRPSSRDILITLFPISIGERYQIVSLRGLREISFEEVLSTLQRELNITNILE